MEGLKIEGLKIEGLKIEGLKIEELQSLGLRFVGLGVGDLFFPDAYETMRIGAASVRRCMLRGRRRKRGVAIWFIAVLQDGAPFAPCR
jgi:hypothetical protein